MDNQKTPRTRLRNEIREKRLAFYEQQPSAKSSNSNHAAAVEDTERSKPRNGTKHEFELNVKELVDDERDAEIDTNIDTSRTSDILMETARDYREIMKERQERQSKRNNGTPADEIKTSDLSDRNVAEVLKVLNQRANQRRREMLRFQNLSDSEEEEEEEEDKEAEERPPQMSEKERVEVPEGDTGNAQKSSEVDRGFLSLLEELHEREKVNRGAEDFRAAYTENLSGSIEAFFSKTLNANQQPLRIAFSAQEIYSQAEKRAPRPDIDQSLPKKSDPPATVPERSRSPVQRNVRFDCPPTPAAPPPATTAATASRAASSASQSLDARSSASGVSCMSVGDVAQRLKQLGINPKLIGLDVPAPCGPNRLNRAKTGRRLVKICPSCNKCNAESVSWCLNCAAVLVGIEPRPLPRRHPKAEVEESLESTGCEEVASFVDSVVESSFDTASLTPVPKADKTAVVEKLFDHWEGDDLEEESKESVTVMETPNSVYDEEVTPLTSPMVPLSPPTPAAVWDPKKMDVAALIQQSRALVGQSAEPQSKMAGKENRPEPEASVTPRPGNRSNARPESVLQSNDTFSSISLASPSTVAQHQSAQAIAKELHLDLSSSLEEASDKAEAVGQVEEIAVLDRAEVLALRQTSAASGKPDLVPQLSLALSSASTERTAYAEENASSSDGKLSDWRDISSLDTSSSCDLPEESPAGRQRPKAHSRHWGGGHQRPSSAMHLQTQNSANASASQTPPRRRPNSSEHHGGYPRRWQNSSLAWSNQHPSVLKKKPAAVVVRDSLNAAKLRDGKPPIAAHLCEDGSVQRPQSRSNAGDRHPTRSFQQPKKGRPASHSSSPHPHSSNNSPHPQHSSNNSPHPKHSSNNSPHPKHSSNNSPRQQHSSNNSPHQQQVYDNNPYQQHAFNNSPHQQHAFITNSHQQQVFNNSVHQQNSSNNSPYQQQVFNNSPHQQHAFITSPHQQHAFITSPHQHHAFVTSPHQQHAFITSPHQQQAFINNPQQQVYNSIPHQHAFITSPHQEHVFNNAPHQSHHQNAFNNGPHQQHAFNNSPHQQHASNTSPRFHQEPRQNNIPHFQHPAYNSGLYFNQHHLVSNSHQQFNNHQSPVNNTPPFQQSAINDSSHFNQQFVMNNAHRQESKMCSPAFNKCLADAASSPIDFLAMSPASPRSEQSSGHQVKPARDPGVPMGLMPDTIRYLEQRGWNAADQSPWLYLADEVWLRILRFLSIEDLTAVAATCRRLHCVANDNSLWRHISVKRRHEMTREDLLRIAARCPLSLKLRQCRAPNMTVQDLNAFFDLCGHSLKKLSFNGCNQGAFSDDQFIVFAALYCPKLTTIDFSYAYGIRDSTVRALAESCTSLQSVKLNGAQKISDVAIQCLIEFHGDSLHTLELYCCFGISSNSVRDLGKKCANLAKVCFGTCTRVSSNALINFAGHRRDKLRHLDLRGLPTVLDSTIASIVAVCPKLESVALSNCCGISNISIRALANCCPALQKLDVCGCNQVGSDGAQDLVRKCKFLEELDFSSTCVDHRTITCLARTYVPKLKTLRLNFCCNLKEDGLSRLCDSTKSLKTLLLFGVRNITPAFIQRLRLEHPRISIKSDDSVENNEQ